MAGRIDARHERVASAIAGAALQLNSVAFAATQGRSRLRVMSVVFGQFAECLLTPAYPLTAAENQTFSNRSFGP